MFVFQSEEMFDLCVRSEDEMLHVALYEWLIARNLTDKLLEVRRWNVETISSFRLRFAAELVSPY